MLVMFLKSQKSARTFVQQRYKISRLMCTRRNEVGIQMLPKSIHNQIFHGEKQSGISEEKFKSISLHLKQHEGYSRHHCDNNR